MSPRRGRLAARLPGQFRFVAEDAGLVVGYALGGRPVREKPLEEFPGAEHHLEMGYGCLDTSLPR